jgi:hypothetical protein
MRFNPLAVLRLIPGTGELAMIRSLVVASLFLLAFASPAVAQKWASDMFPVKTHEFGSVARGAKAEYSFEFQNIYKEDIHVASVRASCGCTTPTIVKDTLKSWEKGAIHAKFNTGLFLGQKGATVTVVIDRPFYAEVQLQVSGFIRSDVVFDPGVVNLGQVDQGASGESKVKITYAGRNNWTITDIQSANSNFEVELSEPTRNNGNVSYFMTVRLKNSTPVGFINDQLTLVTDDVRNQMIPISVEGKVQPALDISPTSVLLGTLESGQSVTKQLVVKSKQKCKITQVKSEHPGFEFKMLNTSDEPKTIHLIPVTFTANSQPGQFSAKIKIDTDLGFSAECNATGTVKSAEVTEGSTTKTPAETTTAKLPE